MKQKILFHTCLLSFLLTALINAQTPNLVSAEYFFDADPGFGNGTPMSFAPDTNVTVQLSIDVSGLSPGVHKLYIRAKDANGKWGIAQPRLVFIQTTNVSTPRPDLTEAEYFFDADPGFGLGNGFSLSSGDSISVTSSINVSGLNPGVHKLYIRAKDETGKWGVAQPRLAMIQLTNPATHRPDLTAAEYFFDSDPGFGNGTDFSFSPDDSISITSSLNVSALAPGLHKLYIRAKDQNGKWGIAQPRLSLIQLMNPETPLPLLTKAEYFFDTDPGFGNASQFTFTPDDSIEINATVSISGLSWGDHKIYLRAKDENGLWSIARHDAFTRASVTLTAPNGGENWQGGTFRNITWVANSVSQVNLEYSLDNGGNWSLIAINVPAANGSHPWLIPNVSSTKCLVRVSNVSNPLLVDQSDGVFTIQSNPNVVWTEDFSSFNAGQYHTAGNAYYDATNQYFVLTPPNNWINGRLYYKTLFSMDEFVAEFDMKIGGGSGADGIVFAMVQNYTYPSSNGGRIDFHGAVGYGVEFDTYHNPEFSDPSEEHIAVVQNSTGNHLSFYIASNGEIEDNQWHHIRIGFNAGQFGVYLDGVNKLNYTVSNYQVFDGYFGFTAATGINNNYHIIDNIIVTSGQASNPITVTSPNGGETWQVGSQQNITWTSAGVANVKIEFSTDGGATWEPPIVNSYPAGNQSYTWTIPNITSGKCKIRISDAENSNIKSESPLFTLRGYWLTRHDGNGDLELFQIGEDNWQFQNSGPNMWPESWWSQFNYKNLLIYPKNFFWAKRSDFVDWPLFTDAFGPENCYHRPQVVGTVRDKKPQDRARLFWKENKGNWPGSCYGFAISCFYVFDYKTEFIIKFPEIGVFNELHDIPITDDPRKVINELWAYQWGTVQEAYKAVHRNDTPGMVLQQLKTMFLSDEGQRDLQFIGFHNQIKSGAHVVNPYKIEIDSNNPDVEYIYVYDSNIPDSPDTRITVINHDNTYTWFYSHMLDWGVGNKEMYLLNPISDFFTLPQMGIALASSVIRFANTVGAAITITDENGNTIGYADSIAFNNLPEGHPIIPFTGSFHPPTGYYLPDGEYSIVMQDYPDTSVNFAVFTDSVIFNYDSYEGPVNQPSHFRYRDNKFSIWDEGNKKENQLRVFQLSALHFDENEERIFEVNECFLSSNDSLHFNMLNDGYLKFVNSGESKSYDLVVRKVDSDTTDQTIERAHVEIPSNSSHQIVPDWNNFSSQTIQILVDSLNDGTIDDTLQGVFFNSYEIITIAGSNGSIIYTGTGTSIDTVIVYHGDSANFVIMPDSGYIIQDVLIDGVSVGPVPSYTFSNITADHTISAQFILSCTPGLLGDITGDGATNSTDGLVLLSYDAGFPLPQPFLDRIAIGFGDVNEDNLTNSTDALITLSWEAGFPVPFPVGQQVCLPDNSRTTAPAKSSPIGLNKTGATIRASAAPANAQLLAGQTIEIPVLVDVGAMQEQLGSYTVALQWNPSVLQFEGYHGGSAAGFDNPVINTAETTNGKLIAAHACPQGAGGVVNILNLQFKVVGTPGADPGLSLKFSALAAARTFTDLLPYLELSEHLLAVEELPTEYAIANYPNPFNASTEIHYQLPEAVKVEIVLFNVLGQKILVLVNQRQEAGKYRLTWNGDSEQGQLLPSGIYFLRMRAGKFVADRKLLLLK